MKHKCKADNLLPAVRTDHRLTHASKTKTRAASAILILVATTLIVLTTAISTMPGRAEADSPQIAQIWVHGSEVSPNTIPEFAPGEIVEIKVPANSILQPVQEANILMCADPGRKLAICPSTARAATASPRIVGLH